MTKIQTYLLRLYPGSQANNFNELVEYLKIERVSVNSRINKLIDKEVKRLRKANKQT